MLTLCRLSMWQSFGPKKHYEISKSDRKENPRIFDFRNRKIKEPPSNLRSSISDPEHERTLSFSFSDLENRRIPSSLRSSEPKFESNSGIGPVVSMARRTPTRGLSSTQPSLVSRRLRKIFSLKVRKHDQPTFHVNNARRGTELIPNILLWSSPDWTDPRSDSFDRRFV